MQGSLGDRGVVHVYPLRSSAQEPRSYSGDLNTATVVTWRVILPGENVLTLEHGGLQSLPIHGCQVDGHSIWIHRLEPLADEAEVVVGAPSPGSRL